MSRSMSYTTGSRRRLRTCAALAVLVLISLLSSCAAARADASPSWQGADVIDQNGNSLSTVSCPSTTMCVSANGNVQVTQGPTLYAFDPDPDGVNTNSLACPTTTFCMLVDEEGGAYTYDGGTEDSSFSKVASVVHKELSSVACPTASLCFATDKDGGIWKWTTGSGWGTATTSTITVDNDPPVIACDPSGMCVAVSDTSSGLLSRTYSSGAWASSTVSFDTGAQTLESLDCTSSTFCLGTDDKGNALTFDGVATWKPTPLETTDEGIWSACSGESCVAIDFNDVAWQTPDAAVPADWTKISPNLHETTLLASPGAITCPSPTVCVAVDGVGDASTYTEPLTQTAPPTISGTLAVGQTLTETPGTWAPAGVALVHTWQHCDPDGACSPDTGDSSDTLTSADAAGDEIYVTEEAGIGMTFEGGTSGKVGPMPDAGTNGGNGPTSPGGNGPTSPGGNGPTSPGGNGPTNPGVATVSYAGLSGADASVKIACPATVTSSCVVKLTLQLTEKLRGHRIVSITAGRRLKTTTKTLVAGTATYTVAPGKSQAAQVALGASWRRLLATGRSVPARLTATTGADTLLSRTLKFPGKRRRR